MVEKAETAEGSVYSVMSPHHFWSADWGSGLRRRWDATGTLHVMRAYQLASSPAVQPLKVFEVPYSPESCSGTGGVVWPASLALASYICKERTALCPPALQSVLEIGAGSGIPGLCIAALAQDADCKVFLTDENRVVLATLRRAVDANLQALTAQVQVAPFAWEQFLGGDAPAPVESVDLLLGSDVIWGERGPVVAQLARRLVRPGGMFILCAQEGRDGLEAFESILREGEPEDGAEPLFEVDLLRQEALAKSCLIYVCRRRQTA